MSAWVRVLRPRSARPSARSSVSVMWRPAWRYMQRRRIRSTARSGDASLTLQRNARMVLPFRRPAALALVPAGRLRLREHLLALVLAQRRHAARLHQDAVVDDRILELERLEEAEERHGLRRDVRGEIADLREPVAHGE